MAITTRCINKVGDICRGDNIFMFVGEIDINEGDGDNSIEWIDNKFLFYLCGAYWFAYKMCVFHKAIGSAFYAELIEVEVKLIGELESTIIVNRITYEWLVEEHGGNVNVITTLALG